MGRKIKVTHSQFMAAWPKCKSVNQAAQKLGVSYVVIYKLIKELNLTTHTQKKVSKLESQIDSLYDEGMNVPAIAEGLELASNTVRYHLMHLVNQKWDSGEFKDYPRPNSPSEYLVMKMINKQPELFDRPEEIARRSAVPIQIVNLMLDKIFKHRMQNDHDVEN